MLLKAQVSAIKKMVVYAAISLYGKIKAIYIIHMIIGGELAREIGQGLSL